MKHINTLLWRAFVMIAIVLFIPVVFLYFIYLTVMEMAMAMKIIKRDSES